MARPLRIDLKDGWYHVINRGLERRRIFEAKADFDRFIRVLGELPARFGVLVHAYALMPNYHLLVQTPEANLSRAIQWLNVCYSVWFNRKRQRVGPLFQGRFKAILVAPDGSHLQVSRYVHLNPVRTRRFGLSKEKPPVAEEGPTPEALIEARVRHLSAYPWSSFAFYCGLKTPPPWLTTEPLLEMLGGATEAQRRRAYRQYVEAPVRAGLEDSLLNEALTGLVVGSKRFVAAMLALAKGDRAQQQAVQRLHRDLAWEAIQAAVVSAKQEPWEAFCNRRGDVGRDLALMVARRFGRYSLAELGGLVGVSYAAVAQAIAKAEKRLTADKDTARLFSTIQEYLKLKA
jgi:putative transposase